MNLNTQINDLHARVTKTESFIQLKFYQDDRHMNELASVSTSLYGDTWAKAIINNTSYADDNAEYARSLIKALHSCLYFKKLIDDGNFDIWLAHIFIEQREKFTT
jgi:hypothetical protein